MNKAFITKHAKPLCSKSASLRVQGACALLLGSLMALPVYAQDRAKPLGRPGPGRGEGSNITTNAAYTTPAQPPMVQPAAQPATQPPQLVQPSLPPAPPSTNPGIPQPGNAVNTAPTVVNSTPKPGVGRGMGPADAPVSLGVSSATQLPSAPQPIASAPSNLGNVLPSAQQLSDSMRMIPTMAPSGLGKSTEGVELNNHNPQCVNVSLRPDTARQSVSLVDFSGDGLIVSAVANSHIQSVFAQTGYAQMDFAQAGRWCIPQLAARALLLPAQGATTQAASLLVQTGSGLQLMSQDQWLAHQAAMKPLAAMTTTAQPRGTKKAVKKLVTKRNVKPLSNVAKSAAPTPAL
jgi:hypothetical protein